MKKLILSIITFLTFHTSRADTVQTFEEYSEEKERRTIPYIDNEFNDFRDAMGFRESSDNYKCVNKWGYMGRYQFGKTTLKSLNITTTKKDFLNNPKLQDYAFKELCFANRWTLRREIRKWVGEKYKGVVITESGILASAHLLGAGNVRKHFKGRKGVFKDALGTSLNDYMKKFGGYKI